MRMLLPWLLLTFVAPWSLHTWLLHAFPSLRGLKTEIAWALGGFASLHFPLSWCIFHWHSSLAASLHTAVVTALIAATALAPLSAWHTLHEFWKRRLSRPAVVVAGGAGLRNRRQALEAAAGLTLLATSGSALGWGAARGRRAFELPEVPVKVAGWPRSLDGYVIVQLSDIHAGAFVDEALLDEGLALVRRAKPDLLVLTGDLVDFDPEYARLVARRLSDLRPRDGVGVIFGNHDHYAGQQAVGSALRAAGIEPLVNSGRLLRAADGGGFALLGVDDLSARRYGRAGPRLEQCLKWVPPDRPRILLSHQPSTVKSWPGKVALQLSGHTHGGQVNPARVLNSAFEYVAGHYQVGSTQLYVNRGFGTVGPPVRVGSPPEVARIVIVAG